jgi:hypothetical protein
MATSGVELKSGPQLTQWHPTIQEYLQGVRQAVLSNNLAAAQQAFTRLQKALGSAPSAGVERIGESVQALGQVLEAGDLPGAEQALGTLRLELQASSGLQVSRQAQPVTEISTTAPGQEDGGSGSAGDLDLTV